MREAVHVVHIVVLTFGVLRFLVMPAAAREIGRLRVVGAGQCPVTHAIAVHVLVARKTTQALKIRRRQYLAALDWLGGVQERIGHPVVHTQIEVDHDEDRGLELLRQIERFDGHAEGFFGRMGKQHGVFGIAV